MYKYKDIATKNREDWIRTKCIEVSAGKCILDAGAGEMKHKEFCTHLEYVAQDFAQYDGKGNEKGLQGDWEYGKLDIVSDIVNIPVENESFDALLCTEVLEHIPYPMRAITEFSRILKPGGEIILTAPFASFSHMAPYYFYSGFSEEFYKKILAEEGFENIQISKNGDFFDYMIQELHRIPFMTKKYCDKKTNIFVKIGIVLIAKYLKRIRGNSYSSSEFTNLGLFVYAKKKNL